MPTSSGRAGAAAIFKDGCGPARSADLNSDLTFQHLWLQVRCQAHGMTAAEVVRDLFATCRTPASLVSSLYAGLMGAALCSIAIGAVHFASYESCKRFLLQKQGASHGQGQAQGQAQAAASSSGAVSGQGHTAAGGATAAAGVASAGAGPAPVSCGSSQGEASSSDVHFDDVPSGPHSVWAAAAASTLGHGEHYAQAHVAASATATSASAAPQDHGSHALAVSAGAAAAGTCSGPADAAGQAGTGELPVAYTTCSSTGMGSPSSAALGPQANQHHHQHHQGAKDGDRLTANVLAALFTAVVTALIESPVELFRHNQQAGLVQVRSWLACSGTGALWGQG